MILRLKKYPGQINASLRAADNLFDQRACFLDEMITDCMHGSAIYPGGLFRKIIRLCIVITNCNRISQTGRDV